MPLLCLGKYAAEYSLRSLLRDLSWHPGTSGKVQGHSGHSDSQDKKALDALNVDFKNTVGWDTPAYTNWNISPVYQNAPTLIFLFAEGNSAMDGGIMTENICIAAKSMGLGTCIIASVGGLMNAPEGRVWKERMDIDPDWQFLIAIAVGFPDEDPAPKPRAEGRIKIFKDLSLTQNS